MHNKLVISGILVVVLITIGAVLMYARGVEKNSDNELVKLSSNTWPQVATPIVKNSDYVVNIATAPTDPQVDVPAKILIETSRNNVRVPVYEEERMLHVILASENRNDFLHTVSVSEEEPGLYSVTHNFKEPGKYRIWVEVDNYGSAHRHGDDAELLAYADFEVTGNASSRFTEVAARDKKVLYNSYVLEMSKNEFIAGDESTLSWQVNKGGSPLPLDDHEPAIYVIVGPNLEYFRHAHADPAADLSTVLVEDTFPVTGDYLLWTDTYVDAGDDVEVVPAKFWLTVK